jgi:hypothetical protein
MVCHRVRMLDDAPSTSKIWSLTILASARLARKPQFRRSTHQANDNMRVKWETLQQQRSENSTTSCAPEFRSLYCTNSQRLTLDKRVPANLSLYTSRRVMGVWRCSSKPLILNIRRRLMSVVTFINGRFSRSTHRIRCCVGVKVCLDALKKIKILFLRTEIKPDSLVVQPLA